MSKNISFNFRLDTKEKKLFFRNAEKIGLSPSALLSMFVTSFNRSEEITVSLHKPIILESFVPDDTENIMEDFRKMKKYSPKFLKDLEAGLKRSSFNKKEK